MIDEQAARDFYNQGGGSYPPVQAPAAPPGWPAAGLQPGATTTAADAVEPAAQPAQAAPAAPVAAQPAAEPSKPAPLDPEAAAEAFYGGQFAPWRTGVDLTEPAVQPGEFVLEAPMGMIDQTDAGKDAMTRLRTGLAEAGAGLSGAREIWADVVRAEQGGAVPVSQRSAEVDLRRAWGDKYDERVRAAQGVVQQVARTCPEVIGFLERSQLGNSPEFIMKLSAIANRRRR